MIEIWKQIDGFNFYEVSNTGKVRSWKKPGCGQFRLSTPKILSQSIVANGYNGVNLYRDGKRCPKRLHILVAKAFIENIKNKPCINHKNGIKTDNNVDNLEWCTYSYNQLHSYRTGLNSSKKGEDHPISKLSEQEVLSIRALYNQGWFYNTEIAKAYNIGRSTLHSIVNNITWSHL